MDTDHLHVNSWVYKPLNIFVRTPLWDKLQNEAPPRRSVAELAGKFKGPAPQPNSAAGNQADKPVRRRPPRTLQLQNLDTDETQPPSGATSPPKAKRNSALVEKLQANLTLGSPTMAPLKSPGLRMLPPGFTPPSPGSAPPVPMATTSSIATPTSPVPTSPSTESPTSFEAPPSVAEGNILQSINKGRPKGSIRRRPPSRCHRKSSSGDDAGVGNYVADTHLISQAEGEEKTTAGGGSEEEGGEVFRKDGTTETSTPPEKKETNEEEETKSSADVKEKEEECTSLPQQGEDEEEKEKEKEVEEKTSKAKQKDPTDETTKEEEEKDESSSR
ncbi:duboraya isoform X1 [Girardinichthys multiradiatus]|uniref:duboraya isoform X1 n=1 Tax=Girardinichthys multiradiatus TaxID=208333 RepID=UPI001FADE9E9|nr:duboraya isoform X1 [Girardinichthys multiradiatus]